MTEFFTRLNGWLDIVEYCMIAYVILWVLGAIHRFWTGEDF